MKDDIRKGVAIVGSINMDLFVSVPSLPTPGETVLGSGLFMCVGGKGSNQAAACARLGAESLMIGKIGHDFFGNQMIETLNGQGVNTTYVTRTDEAASGVAMVNVDPHGENTVVVVPGANRKLSPDDVDAVRDVFDRVRVLAVQLEIALETVERALMLAKQAGVVTVLNPAPGHKLSKAMLSHVDYLTPNETELEVVTGRRITSKEERRQASKCLLDQGVGAVIHTLGDEGALLVSEKGEHHFPAVNVDVVDTTGAGDAYTGCLATFLAEGASLEEAVAAANRYAALCVTRPGAQPSLATRSEFEDFCARLPKE